MDSDGDTAPQSATTRGLVVVIDGPAGAGKSTISKTLAAELGLMVLDTGALYRVVALEALRRGIAWSEGPKVAAMVDELEIEFHPDRERPGASRVSSSGCDVTQQIRDPEISEGASLVSAHAAVRAALLGLQRAAAASGCVAEGRDMGTVVFPEADYKFFLTASLESRAGRRHAELKAVDSQKAPDLATVKREMEVRDERDANREVAPLKPAEDAKVIDSSELGVEEVLHAMLAHIRA